MLNRAVCGAVVLFTGFACCLRADLAPTERNKAVARRVFDDIFNKHLQVAAEIYARDFVNHGLRRQVSLQEDQEAVGSEVTAFPDLKITVEGMVAEGDYVPCG